MGINPRLNIKLDQMVKVSENVICVDDVITGSYGGTTSYFQHKQFSSETSSVLLKTYKH